MAGPGENNSWPGREGYLGDLLLFFIKSLKSASFMCLSVLLHVCIFTLCVPDALGGSGLELQKGGVCHHVGAGSHPQSFARAARAVVC